MALVQPTVIDLLPIDVIIVNVASGLGSSDPYQLVTVLSIASGNRINVDLTVTIRDPALFTFTDNTTVKTFRFNQSKDNDTVAPQFAIKNVVPLTGASLRLRVETNDILTPAVKLQDTSEHGVVYKQA
jgi:hypothetical protein